MQLIVMLLVSITVCALPANATGVPNPPVGEDPWLASINWWRSFGGSIDGTPMVNVTDSSATDRGPQNFVDYLMYLRRMGSDYCLHWEDPAFPRPVGVDYSHGVLFCGPKNLSSAVEGWMTTPYHSAGLSPHVDKVASGFGTYGASTALALLFQRSLILNKTYVWPKPGGYMPRQRWLGGEWPNPADVCPPVAGAITTNGQPSFVWFPRTNQYSNPQRKLVSLTASDTSGVVPMCIPMITDYSARPYLQQAATPGTVISDSPLFPQRMWKAGTATISLVTTDVNGADRQTLTWSFEVLAPPSSVKNARVVQVDAEIGRVFWDEGSPQIENPVLGYSVEYFDWNSGEVQERETETRFIDLPYPLFGIWVRTSPDIYARNAAGLSERAQISNWNRLTDDRKPVTHGLRLVSAGLPANATLALVNLTMADIFYWEPSHGYITAKPCGSLYDEEQSTSSGNFVENVDVANLAVVPLDSDGTFCIYHSNLIETIVDTQGYFASTGTLAFTPLDPKRVLDTRQTVRPQKGSTTRVETGLPAGSQSALVNLTMTGLFASDLIHGYITADKCSSLVAGPQTKSNGNFNSGIDVSNLSVVSLDSDGSFCIYSEQAVDLVVDVQGSFSTSGATKLSSMTTQRVLDTRASNQPLANSITRVNTGAATGSRAALVNLTMTGASNFGYITADKCSSLQSGPQSRSNGNFRPEADVSNLSVVPLDTDGSFCIYSEQAVDLVVDVQGLFSPTGTLRFTPTNPSRVLDTRTWSS
ncbi:MAG: hypothetical protein WCK23_10155 [Actinomycetes bacterium]